jgi:transcriptional regulator with XRE-family HTH domain
MTQKKLKKMLPFLNTSGKRIRILRNDLGYSQPDLVEVLQKNGITVSQSALSRYERDETDVGGKVVAAIAKLFGVTTDYLLLLTDIPSVKDEEREADEKPKQIVDYSGLEPETFDLIQRFVAIFTELAPRDQALLLNMAATMRQADTPHIIGEDHDPK